MTKLDNDDVHKEACKWPNCTTMVSTTRRMPSKKLHSMATAVGTYVQNCMRGLDQCGELRGRMSTISKSLDQDGPKRMRVKRLLRLCPRWSIIEERPTVFQFITNALYFIIFVHGLCSLPKILPNRNRVWSVSITAHTIYRKTCRPTTIGCKWSA